MDPDLSGQSALVTGAGRGIGRAISLTLAAAGARVYLAARTASQLADTETEIREAGGRAKALPADLTKETEIEAIFKTIRDETEKLDILVNNAGVGIYGPLAEFPSENYDRIMQINVKAVFLCCREALSLMIAARKGYIINISSVVGFKGYPNQAVYTASKHAIMGLTKSLAVEAQEYGVRVSAILPGGVDTKLGYAARPDLDPAVLLQPEDIAHTVLYLLSLSERAAVDQVYIRRIGSKPF
jgi:3-oxoacyl-[acyl-carrier protein] reductase